MKQLFRYSILAKEHFIIRLALQPIAIVHATLLKVKS